MRVNMDDYLSTLYVCMSYYVYVGSVLSSCQLLLYLINAFVVKLTLHYFLRLNTTESGQARANLI